MKNSIEVANLILVNEDEEILLLRRALNQKRPGLWSMPGGIIDSGEVPRAAAERELQEETGITKEQIAITDILRFLVCMPHEEIKIHSYLASLIVDAQVVLDPFEHTAYRWQTQHSIFASSDLLPCVPSMIAATLSPGLLIRDLTITEGVSLRQF